MKKTVLRINVMLLALALLTAVLCASVVSSFWRIGASGNSVSNLNDEIQHIINWKKTSVGATQSDNLINDEFLRNVPNNINDWYVFSMARTGISDDYIKYVAKCDDYVTQKYQTEDKLGLQTEYARISIALAGVGANARQIASHNGEKVDLIADGILNKELSQGINSLFFSLICLDTLRFEANASHLNTRESIIKQILANELSGGGFGYVWDGVENFDVDYTAMAVQALAPYYNSQKTFKFHPIYNKDESGQGQILVKTVKQVVDNCLILLSENQSESGGYFSWGSENVYSNSQVALALSSLNISLDDQRFVKGGKNLLDAILMFKNSNGGFKGNMSESNSDDFATYQVLQALVAVQRFENGQRTYFDIREDFSQNYKNAINEVCLQIDKLEENSTKKQVEIVVDCFNKINEFDRMYIKNYDKMQSYAKKHNIEILETKLFVGQSTLPNDNTTVFSQQEKTQVDNLPVLEMISTEFYEQLVVLKFAIENSDEFEGKQAYLQKIQQSYDKVLQIKNDIKMLDDEIENKIYPLDKIGLSEHSVVYGLLEKFNALHDYDKLSVKNKDDLMIAKTKVDNALTAIIVWGVVICLVVAVCVFVVILFIVKKRRKQKIQMAESEE